MRGRSPGRFVNSGDSTQGRASATLWTADLDARHEGVHSAVADLNARSDSFISLLLDVAGKARPSDIAGMSADEATALLQAYAAAHPERGLTFDGSQLAPAAVPAAAPTAAAAAPAPVAPEPYPAAAPSTPAGWESPVTTPDPYAMPATPVTGAYGAPQPVADPYAVPASAVDAYGVPVTDPYGTPQSVAPETAGVPAAPAPEPANPELPSWVYEQPAPAPAYQGEAFPAAAVGAAAVGAAAVAETPAAVPAPAYQGEAPGADFEEQLLADLDDGLPPLPEPVKEKRASTSVSPVIWIALVVVVLAAVAVVALDYFGVVSILGLNPQASTPTPAPAPSVLPPGVPTSTPEVTSSVPSSPTP